MSTIRLRGVRTHNLKSIDLDIPHGLWTAVVGPSGSGKTSLVHDTLVREGQQRFLGAWSPRVRRILGKLGHADADAIHGLPVPISIGAGRLTRSERSTVGTLTSIDALLRIGFARGGSGGPHLASDFSFNSTGACPDCKGRGEVDAIDQRKVVVDPTKSIRDGALGPTLGNGYTVYSQVTLEVMDQIAAAHAFSVHTPWDQLTAAQHDVVLFGTQALKVPFGKHGLESRLKWEGITAKPREEGYYQGIIPVMTETLARSRNPNILRYARTQPCPECHGTRLGHIGRSTSVKYVTLPQLLQLPLCELTPAIPHDGPLWTSLGSELHPKVERMVRLGLGHLSLARRSTTLSDGELQRTRLASQLGLRLSGMLIAIDEPTLGMHPSAHPALAAALWDLRDQGNTVVTVEHDPDFVLAADRVLEMGPKGGSKGGEVMVHAPMTTQPIRAAQLPSRQRAGTRSLTLRGARLHNLNTDLGLKVGTFTVVSGPSGSGKSSLLFGTLLPALQGHPGAYDSLTGADGLRVLAVDSKPLGATSRSTPATYTGLFDTLRKTFAKLPASKAAGLTASAFSHNQAAGRCPACEGLGVQRVGLHLMRDVEEPCIECQGGRYAPHVLVPRWKGLSIADVLRLTIAEALTPFADLPAVFRMLTTLVNLGVGHLQLGRPTTTLSRGETQRVKLATVLGKPTAGGTILLLDEPDRGLHTSDLEPLVAGLQALVDEGHTVVAISHHRSLWAAADHRVDLHDGVVQPSPMGVSPTGVRTQPVTLSRHPNRHPEPAVIALRGVQTRGLQSVDVDIPKATLTVVTGVSGSGKSSLVFHTLASEAQHRFAETLPIEARRALRQLPAPVLLSADGLGPTVSMQQRFEAPTGSTLATHTGLGPLLRLLWSRRCDTSLSAEHFSRHSPLGACSDCQGRGQRSEVSPQALQPNPILSLKEGALAGTAPGRFFMEPKSRHLALLQVILGDVVLDTPWADLDESTRTVVWHGSGLDPIQATWNYVRGARTGTHDLNEPWLGLLHAIAEEAPRRWDRKNGERWRAVFVERTCVTCGGNGMTAAARSADIDGLHLPTLLDMPMATAALTIERWGAEPHATRALCAEIASRLHAFIGVGLTHLPLTRPTAHLSTGERQWLELAAVSSAALDGLTLVLDEPGATLHPQELAQLTMWLRSQVSDGHTVIVVSHRDEVLAAADHEIRLGPGSGPQGGRVVYQGLPSPRPLDDVTQPPPPAGPIEVRGLQPDHGPALPDLHLPIRGLVVIAGPTGCGKSQLLRTILAPTFTEKRPVGCLEASGLDRFAAVHTAEPPGLRQRVITALQLLPALQKAFHNANPGRRPSAYSPMSAAGRCPTCKGQGASRIRLDVLPDVFIPCASCDGSGLTEDVRTATFGQLTLADALALPLIDVAPHFTDTPLEPTLARAIELSLGHLNLGRTIDSLSGGERQRLPLCKPLSAGASLWLLDNPDQGLHADDIPRLAGVLRRSADGGDLMVIVSNRRSMWRHADFMLLL